MTDSEIIRRAVSGLSAEQRSRLFQHLREEFPIHPIESELNTSAEVVLEAISRSNDLTIRGIRGVIAEAAFAMDVLATHDEWEDLTPAGNFPYDFLLQDDAGQIRIQVKLQRRKKHRPMRSEEAPRRLNLPGGMYVVEVQRTRGGKDPKTGHSTRPYRFGEFDILAVSLQPHTGEWNSFMYTVADWLIPRRDNPACMEIYQPVSPYPTAEWTDDLSEVVKWFRDGIARRLPQVASSSLFRS